MMYTNFMYQKLTTSFYSFIGYYKTKSWNELFFPCAPILTGDNFNFLLINLFFAFLVEGIQFGKPLLLENWERTLSQI